MRINDCQNCPTCHFRSIFYQESAHGPFLINQELAHHNIVSTWAKVNSRQEIEPFRCKLTLVSIIFLDVRHKKSHFSNVSFSGHAHLLFESSLDRFKNSRINFYIRGYLEKVSKTLLTKYTEEVILKYYFLY